MQGIVTADKEKKLVYLLYIVMESLRIYFCVDYGCVRGVLEKCAALSCDYNYH